MATWLNLGWSQPPTPSRKRKGGDIVCNIHTIYICMFMCSYCVTSHCSWKYINIRYSISHMCTCIRLSHTYTSTPPCSEGEGGDMLWSYIQHKYQSHAGFLAEVNTYIHAYIHTYMHTCMLVDRGRYHYDHCYCHCYYHHCFYTYLPYYYHLTTDIAILVYAVYVLSVVCRGVYASIYLNVCLCICLSICVLGPGRGPSPVYAADNRHYHHRYGGVVWYEIYYSAV
jgi:hypothetical protein